MKEKRIMKIKINKIIGLLCLSTIFLSACSSNAILGSFNGNSYNNSKKGISFTKPSDWSVASTEKLYTDMTAMNTAVGLTVDSNIAKSLDDLQILRLFVISKGSDSADTIEKYYPQFTCVVEKRTLSTSETAEVVLKDYMSKMLSLDGYTVQGEASIVTINNKNYYAATSKKSTSDATFYRTIYCLYKDNSIITFDYMALDESKDDLNSILKTLVIK